MTTPTTPTPLITIPEFASLTNALYNYNSAMPKVFDYISTGDIIYGIKHLNGVDVVVMRGSVTFVDWLHDFAAITLPLIHGAFGPVHPGFYSGMENVWRDIQLHSKSPWVVGGHSLGAARAVLLTAIMKLNKTPPLRTIVFGCPRPGFKPLEDYLADQDMTSIRNVVAGRDDLVTEVPLTLPPFEEYLPCRAYTDISVDATQSIKKSWGPFALHNFSLYEIGSANLI